MLDLRLPSDSLSIAALDLARNAESASVFNHSVRSYLWALLLAEHDGLRPSVDFDGRMLFAATVLHDLGTGSAARGQQRFEVEGADLAAAFLTAHEIEPEQVDLVWEAIAIHTSAGIAERRGPLAYLTREGVGIDFGRRADLVETDRMHVTTAYPRLNMVRSLVDAIVEQAARSENAAPRYSTPGELLRERNETGTSRMEQAAIDSTWGD